MRLANAKASGGGEGEEIAGLFVPTGRRESGPEIAGAGGRAAGLFSLRGHRSAPRHWEGGEGGKGAARGGVEWSKACADLVGLRVGLP